MTRRMTKRNLLIDTLRQREWPEFGMQWRFRIGAGTQGRRFESAICYGIACSVVMACMNSYRFGLASALEGSMRKEYISSMQYDAVILDLFGTLPTMIIMQDGNSCPQAAFSNLACVSKESCEGDGVV